MTTTISLKKTEPIVSQLPNQYAKANQVIYRDIERLQPPTTIPYEDREMIQKLYESYRKTK